MTSNHLLLYRIAELMLEQEQHILPVDLLFDDDQIGDFVKSIQIDSPYQQMLFEGVLTESVRDEKLFVSFTVEGYFHYVLGEVIFNKSQEFGAEALKQIVEENKLNGAKEGVEQCLIKDIKKQKYERLFSLIDSGGEMNKYCSVPFSYALVYANNNQSQIGKTENKVSIEYLVDSLLDNPTENDFRVLFNSILNLERTQKNNCLLNLFNILTKIEKYENIDFLKIIIKGLPYLEQELKSEILNRLQNEVDKFSDHSDYPEIIFELGTKWLLSLDFKMAVGMFEKSKLIFESKEGNFDDKIEKIYSNLGAAFWYQGDIKLTKYYFELSFEKCIQIYGYHHPYTSGALQNLALVNVLLDEYEKSIEIFNKALDISLKNEGLNHPNSARIYSNIGSAYLRLGKLEIANEFFQKALTIDLNVLHSFHPNLALDYDDIGDILLEQGDKQDACLHYEKSKTIFIKNYGINYPHVKVLEEKIQKLLES